MSVQSSAEELSFPISLASHWKGMLLPCASVQFITLTWGASFAIVLGIQDGSMKLVECTTSYCRWETPILLFPQFTKIPSCKQKIRTSGRKAVLVFCLKGVKYETVQLTSSRLKQQESNQLHCFMCRWEIPGFWEAYLQWHRFKFLAVYPNIANTGHSLCKGYHPHLHFLPL